MRMDVCFSSMAQIKNECASSSFFRLIMYVWSENSIMCMAFVLYIVFFLVFQKLKYVLHHFHFKFCVCVFFPMNMKNYGISLSSGFVLTSFSFRLNRQLIRD